MTSTLEKMLWLVQKAKSEMLKTENLKISWALLLSVFQLLSISAFAQPLLPPGAALFSSSSTNTALAVVPPPPPTSLPFRFWTRQSGPYTAASIATITNVLRFHVAAGTNFNSNTMTLTVTNAEWNSVFTNWPATQHLHVVLFNDGKSLIGPPKQLFWQVTQFK